MVSFEIGSKVPVSSLLSSNNLVSRLRLLNKEGTWPVKPLEERDKISNLKRLPNSEGIEEKLKLLEARSR